MTAPNAPAFAARQIDGFSLFGWAESNWQRLLFGAGALAALAGGIYWYGSARDRRERDAERAYFVAREPLASGNLPRAEAELRKVVGRYNGTTGSIQAGLLLAQLQYDQEKFADGVRTLGDLRKAKAGTGLESARLALLAAGYEEEKDFANAGASYSQAAEESRFIGDRAKLQLDQARALMEAGKPKDAFGVLVRLRDDSDASIAAAARLLIGALQAKRP